MGHRARDDLRDGPDIDLLGCPRSPTIGFRPVPIIKSTLLHTYFLATWELVILFTLIFPSSFIYSRILGRFDQLFYLDSTPHLLENL